MDFVFFFSSYPISFLFKNIQTRKLKNACNHCARYTLESPPDHLKRTLFKTETRNVVFVDTHTHGQQTEWHWTEGAIERKTISIQVDTVITMEEPNNKLMDCFTLGTAVHMSTIKTRNTF